MLRLHALPARITRLKSVAIRFIPMHRACSPLAVITILVALVVLGLPHWRSRAQEQPASATDQLTPSGLTVNQACPAITINTSVPVPATATVGSTFSTQLNANSGTGPYTFAAVDVTALPPGMTVYTVSAAYFLGTPPPLPFPAAAQTLTKVGSYNFSVRVTDSLGCTSTQAYTMNVTCPTISFALPASNVFLSATLNATYTQNVQATPPHPFNVNSPPPYSYSLVGGALPNGVTLQNPQFGPGSFNTIGKLQGTPTETGTFTFTIRATGFSFGYPNNCFGEQQFTLTVNLPTPPSPLIIVNTTADTVAVDGFCSLREAIQAADTNAAVNECPSGTVGLTTIEFALGAGTPTINVTGAGLPAITEPLTINGNTGGATRVVLNGAGANPGVNGLNVSGSGSTLRYLAVGGFSAGIILEGGGAHTVENSYVGTNATGAMATGNSNGIVVYSPNNIIGPGNVISGNLTHGVRVGTAAGNVIKGNFIGTNAAGTAALGNLEIGVSFEGENTVIGGTVPGERNIISGNAGVGIQGGGNNVRIQGNYIGTDVTGTIALPHSREGIFLVSSNSLIGGTTAAARNLISGNNGSGIGLAFAAMNNQVQGNYIGTNAAGTAALPNGSGVAIVEGAHDNFIGGTATGTRNVISGNTGAGVTFYIRGNNNTVQGNVIGVDATGAAALPNSGHGVHAIISSGNLIGGTTAGAANRIAYNGQAGVFISDDSNNPAINNRVLANEIYANGWFAIDLAPFGVTPNDAGDSDTGPNNLQNFPVISAVTPTGLVTGTIDTITGNPAVRIEFFASSACDSSNHGEGEKYLGFVNAATPGNFSFTFDPADAVGKPFITATATDADGNTSEFSRCFTIPSCAPPAITTQPANQTGVLGNNVIFSAAVGGTPAPTAQWQVSNDNGATFNNLSGATNATLTLTNLALGQNGYRYRAVFTNSCGSVTSNAAVLTVVNTGGGTNVAAVLPPGSPQIVFANVIVPGNTTVTPIAPVTAGPLPPGYVLVPGLNVAFEITTTAAFSGLVTLTFDLPSGIKRGEYNQLRIAHNESGVLIDRTKYQQGNVPAPGFGSNQISAQVTSFSPFVVAAQTTVPTTTLTATPSPVTFGQTVNFTAQVAQNGVPITTGSVTFKEGATMLVGPIALDANGQASFSTANLSAGSHTFRAEYGGSVIFLPSQGNTTFNVICPPIIAVNISAPASGALFPVGTPVNFIGAFTGAAGLTHTANWNFASNLVNVNQPGTVNESAGTVSASYAFAQAGVYQVTLTVANNCGNTGSVNTSGADQLSALVVIYDPSAGHVTGGGWITSPLGAYVPNPSLTGKANFGFVSKYQNGAGVPTGNTEFQFKAGNLNFKSTAYEWLVIAGARAQYKGSGTINNLGVYRFMLTAIDGQVNGGGGQDKFRIRIWNDAGGGLVYDNQLNAPDSDEPTTTLGGGNIVIHKNGGNAALSSKAVVRDFDGDGKSDLAQWHAELGEWQVVFSSDGELHHIALVEPNDKNEYLPVAADFDGDRKTDAAVWRARNGVWLIKRSSDGELIKTQFGMTGDVPMPADFDSDGRADLAVWRNGDGWHIQRSGNFTEQALYLGLPGDAPVVGDFDGDGLMDVAVFRAKEGRWLSRDAATGMLSDVMFGQAGDKPMAADYDGDGKDDLLLLREGTSYVRRSSDQRVEAALWGSLPAGEPVMFGDYDGDGRAEPAVWRLGDGVWWIFNSAAKTFRRQP